MKAIKMLSAGESPDFGPFDKGDILTGPRVSEEAMHALVERGMAAWTDPPATEPEILIDKEVTPNGDE